MLGQQLLRNEVDVETFEKLANFVVFVHALVFKKFLVDAVEHFLSEQAAPVRIANDTARPLHRQQLHQAVGYHPL